MKIHFRFLLLSATLWGVQATSLFAQGGFRIFRHRQATCSPCQTPIGTANTWTNCCVTKAPCSPPRCDVQTCNTVSACAATTSPCSPGCDTPTVNATSASSWQQTEAGNDSNTSDQANIQTPSASAPPQAQPATNDHPSTTNENEAKRDDEKALELDKVLADHEAAKKAAEKGGTEPTPTAQPALTTDDAEKAAADKAAADKAAADKAAEEQAAAEKAAEEKAAAEKAAEEKAAAEKAAAEKAAAEKAAAEKAAADKAAADKAAADKAAADKAAADKAAAEKAAAEKAAAEKAAADKAAADKAAADKAAADKAAAEKAAADKAAAWAGKKGVVVLESIQVANTKAAGGAWDNGSDAEIQIFLSVNGSAWNTSAGKDKNSVEYKKETISVGAGDKLSIKVVDVDVLFSDPIGSYEQTITEKDLQSGMLDLKFEQVESLKLQLRPE